MSDWPRADGKLIARLMEPETEATAQRLRRMRAFARDGAPAEVHRFGEATVLVCPALPELGFFNSTHGLTDANADQLESILGCYRRHQIRARMWVSPGLVGTGLMRQLTAAGLQPVFWSSVLHRLPGAMDPPNAVPVRELERTEADGLLAADLFMRGFGMSDDDQNSARASIADWIHTRWWRFYVAEPEGEPVAMAILAIRDGVGYLAAAATLEAARGKGCQSALIARRVSDATAAGCDILSVQTGFATQSQANQERFGFRLAATTVLWEEPKPA